MSLSKVAIFGFLTGIRSATAPAIVSHHLSQQKPDDLKGTPLVWLENDTVAQLFKVAAVGETIGDKLPFVPSRTLPPVLMWRMLWGGILGAALTRKREERLTHIVVGAISAAAGAYVAHDLRKAITDNTGIPDVVLGVAEDVIVVTVGQATINA